MNNKRISQGPESASDMGGDPVAIETLNFRGVLRDLSENLEHLSIVVNRSESVRCNILGPMKTNGPDDRGKLQVNESSGILDSLHYFSKDIACEIGKLDDIVSSLESRICQED